MNGMDFLKALIVLGPNTPQEIISQAFDAPGWLITSVPGMGIADLFEKKIDFSEFDWLILDVPFSHEQWQTYQTQAAKIKEKKNYGVICVQPQKTIFQSPQDLKKTWQIIAQAMYSAFFAPESIPCEPYAVLKSVDISGYLKFQAPIFARMSSLLLANLSQDPTRINLGLWEMLINGIEHGNLSISHQDKREHVENNNMDDLVQYKLTLPAFQQRYVSVSFDLKGVEGFFDITDDGAGFDWQNFWEIDHTRMFDKCGRGIALARMAGFDQIDYIGCGNHVQCTAVFNPKKDSESSN